MLGIFDSGLGGLTVVRALLDRKPDLGFVYLGDTARVPYGNRSPETIRTFAHEDVAWLVAQGATEIVVACNTVSATALEVLRSSFPRISLIDVISPVVHHVASSAYTRVGIIGTRATIASGAYEQALHALQPSLEVFSHATPLFVSLIEEGWERYPETQRIVRRSLAPLRQKQIDALICACTHYPILLPRIKQALQKRVVCIDAPAVVAEEVLCRCDTRAGDQRYCFTDTSLRLTRLAESWMKRSLVIEKATQQ